MSDKPTKLYRYRGYSYWEEGNPNPICTIELETLAVLKYTEKGVWINKAGYWLPKIEKGIDHRFHKFVLLSGRKRFAYPDKESAWVSFEIRKRYQIRHLKDEIQAAETLIDMAQQNVMKSSDLDISLVKPKKLNLFGLNK